MSSQSIIDLERAQEEEDELIALAFFLYKFIYTPKRWWQTESSDVSEWDYPEYPLNPRRGPPVCLYCHL